MSNKEILEQAITKAIAGGYRYWDYPEEELTVESFYHYFGDDHGGLLVNDIIFDHDFAKALWGEELHIDKSLAVLPIKTDMALSVVHTEYGAGVDGDVDYKSNPAWQYHLQAMVIAPDPIQYLGENPPLDNHKKYMVQ